MLLVATHAPELDVKGAEAEHIRFSAKEHKQEHRQKQLVFDSHICYLL
jgi:hypothetical protein